MVELAIILPLMVMLLVAVTEIGRAIVQYNALTKALQDGARHAAAYGLLGTTGSVYIDGGLENEIRNLVVYGDTQGGTTPLVEGLTPGQVEVSVPGPGLIQVAATYPYVPVMGSSIPTFGYGSPTGLAVNLRAAVTMRAL